jgi:hypothetical protein
MRGARASAARAPRRASTFLKDMTHRLLLTALAALALPALAACGSASHAATTTAPAATPAAAPVRAAAPRYLDRHALALQLGNGFRAALDRLAVMEQPPEGATDLGQALPAGLLRDVACGPAAARPDVPARAAGRPWPWRCRVRWETLRGTTKSTTYAVRLLPTGCFAAGARPQLPPHIDPTIKTYSEHPLNTIASLGKGC